MSQSVEQDLPLVSRLWIYQSERFPVFRHGVLIVAFALSAVCISALLRGQTEPPSLISFWIAFGVLFGLFLQLRITDEFKDAETDAKYRPERAVPRGLVSLKELLVVGIITALVQIAITAAYSPALLLILLAVWGYMALMTVEFFVPKWLRSHLFFYMVSHMAIMPLIDLFATASDWMVVQGTAPPGLFWFLAVSLFNGILLEIGRKTWAPESEREGVESYSAQWGIKKSIMVWYAAVCSSFFCAMVVAHDINFLMPSLIILAVLHGILALKAHQFHKDPSPEDAKMLENLSGLWVLAIYLLLGIIPMGINIWL